MAFKPKSKSRRDDDDDKVINMKTRKPYKYSPTHTRDSIRRRVTESTRGQFDGPFKSGFDNYFPKEGKRPIRILPPTWDGHDHFGYHIAVHSWIGADRGTHLCPRVMLKKRCPICEASDRSREANEEEEAVKLAAKNRVVYWVLDMAEDSESKSSPQLYMVSKQADGVITDLCNDEEAGKVIQIDDPNMGRRVFVRRTGSRLNTKYSFSLSVGKGPISENSKTFAKIMDFINANPIPGLLKYKSYDELKAIISGDTEEPDEDAVDEEADDESENEGREARQHFSGRRKAKDDDEDEEQEDQEEESSDDEEDEEDEPPRKPAARRKAKDKDEDEDEEQEDERPRRKAKAKTRDEDDETEEEESEDDEEEDAGEVDYEADDEGYEAESSDENEDDEGEDEAPRRKPVSRGAKVKRKSRR